MKKVYLTVLVMALLVGYVFAGTMSYHVKTSYAKTASKYYAKYQDALSIAKQAKTDNRPTRYRIYMKRARRYFNRAQRYEQKEIARKNSKEKTSKRVRRVVIVVRKK
jgi:ABC-type Zn uptake system ZnuABC Zn-binding protein ZnuA